MTLEELKQQADDAERQWVAACNEATKHEEVGRTARTSEKEIARKLTALLTVLRLYGIRPLDDDGEVYTGHTPQGLSRDEAGQVVWVEEKYRAPAGAKAP